MKNALDQIYDYIAQHFDEHLAVTQRYLFKPSISTQNVGIQECAEITTEMLRNLGYRASKTRLVLDK